MNKPSLLVRRILAYLIDCAIIYSFFAITQLTMFSSVRAKLGEAWFHNGYNTEMYTLITISIPVLFYFTFSDSERRGSLGKRFLKITIQKAGTHTSPSLGTTFIRTICKLLPWEVAHLANNIPVPLYYDENPGFRLGLLISFALIIIYIIVLVKTKGRQTLYDQFFNTSVAIRSVV